MNDYLHATTSALMKCRVLFDTVWITKSRRFCLMMGGSRRSRYRATLLSLFFVFTFVSLVLELKHLGQYPRGIQLQSQQERLPVEFRSSVFPESYGPCEEDPLDDKCKFGLTGFPPKPLSIKEARMCDEKIQPMLKFNRELRCETDATCVKCRSAPIKNTKALEAAFNGKPLKADRARRLELWFRKANKPVIVSSVNYGQLYLFLNWANSCIVNGVMDPRDHVWVIPTDKRAFDIISGFGFHTEPIDWLSELGVRISENYRGGANVGGHALINSITVFAANTLLDLDMTTLVMDVDMVFVKDVFPYLKRAAAKSDLLGMYSPRHDSYGYMNSGFLYINPTMKSKILMKTLENLTFLKKGSDQVLWNSVLRHYRFQQVQQRVLPREYFFTMWGHATAKQSFDPVRVKCIHFVSIDKAKRIIRLGHWYFNETYPFYDKDVLEYVDKMHLFGKGVDMESRDRIQTRD